MKIEIRPSVLFFVAVMTVLLVPRLGWRLALPASVVITACVFLHEVAHAAVARWQRIPVSRIGIGVLGGFTVRKPSDHLWADFRVTAAGPLMNLALYAFFRLFSSPFASFVALCNLVLAIANLVPLGPTDGARLKRTFRSIMQERHARRLTRSVPQPANAVAELGEGRQHTPPPGIAA